MKTLHKILTVAITALTVQQATAQQDPLVSEYMFNQLFLNPAYAGAHPYTNGTLVCRDQWISFPGAPVTEIASVDGALKNKNIGIGGEVLNDHIGVSTRTALYGDYSYHLKLDEKNTLAMGLKGGVEYYNANLRDLTVWDEGDHAFMNNVQSKFIPVIGPGLYFYGPNYYAGISIPNALSYKPGTFLYINLNNEPQFIRHYYFTGGYTYTFSDAFALKPSVLLKYVKGAPAQADFNLSAMFQNELIVGVSYRTGDSFLAMVEFYAMKNLRIGYAFDYSYTDMRFYAYGSHEISVSYNFGDEAKTGKPQF